MKNKIIQNIIMSLLIIIFESNFVYVEATLRIEIIDVVQSDDDKIRMDYNSNYESKQLDQLKVLSEIKINGAFREDTMKHSRSKHFPDDGDLVSSEIKFDGRGLSTGVYFYRLQAGSFVSSKKMMMVK